MQTDFFTYSGRDKGTSFVEHDCKIVPSLIVSGQGHVGSRDHKKGDKKDGNGVSPVGNLNIGRCKDGIQDNVVKDDQPHVKEAIPDDLIPHGTIALKNYAKVVPRVIRDGIFSLLVICHGR